MNNHIQVFVVINYKTYYLAKRIIQMLAHIIVKIYIMLNVKIDNAMIMTTI